MRIAYASLAAGALATAALAGSHSLSIDPSQSKKSKFGISTLLESSINFCTDGGIYAELIRNRAFQEEGDTSYWKSSGSAQLQQTKKNQLSDALPNSVLVKSSSNNKEFGLRNEGFFGVPVKPQTYNVSFYARSDTEQYVKAKAGLFSHKGKQYASVDVPLDLTSSWKQFTAELKNSQSADNSKNNTFGLTFPAGTSEIQLNLISLFPPTYQDTIGRPDLVQVLADLKAPYTRLPGGNELEGNTIKQAFNWSEAVGPLKDRPGRPSVWAGYDTEGYGVHEMLNLFESIGSEPILGVYGGYSLDGSSVSKDDLEPYVQSAVNQLHYIKDARGSSAHAKRREANGRAEPWTLNYVEIGNEDWLGEAPIKTYSYRYPAFYQALKSAFPDIKYLASSPYSTDKSKLEAIDQHDYNTPAFAYSQFQTHDSWPRNGTEIMELEYAVLNNGRCGEADETDLYSNSCRLTYPTLESALAEAAWTAGFERNGDLVTAAAYAPLFRNDYSSQWNPDLIGFNHDTVARTPSYWVQYGYSRNRIDQILSANLTSGSPGPIYWSAGLLQGSNNLSLKLINSDSKSQTVNVKLDKGHRFTSNKGSTWGISGNDRDAVNTVQSPNTISPKKGSVSANGDSMTVKMSGHSFQVITIGISS